MDMDNIYAFSNKDIGMMSKFDATDISWEIPKLVYTETNDNLTINDECFSTFDGSGLEHTIITMY